ncbi:MAG: hypothetical protein OD811_05835, partial [Alphaproteobacteria bacterium]
MITAAGWSAGISDNFVNLWGLTAAKFTKGLNTNKATATVTVSPAPLIPEMSIAAASAVEGNDIAVIVSLNTPATQAISGKYSLSDGTATVADYTLPAEGVRVFTIADSERTATFNVAALADTLVEGDETLTVTITSDDPAKATLASGGDTATLTVRDANTAALSLSVPVGTVFANNAVDVTGSLGSLDIVVGAGGALVFTDTANSLVLTFTDTDDGAGGSADGILSGAELMATVSWTPLTRGTKTLSFVATSGLPAGTLTAADFTRGVSGSPATLSVPVVGVLFNFIQSTGKPRTWSYTYPYDLTSTTQLLTLELAEPTTSAVVFNLAGSTDGIDPSEAAASSVYSFPRTITVGSGGTTATATVALTLPTGLRRFYVVASPAVGGVYDAGVAGRVEFVVNALAAPLATNSLAFYPTSLTIKQGGTGVFSVTNLLNGAREPSPLAKLYGKFALPTGITLTSPDGTTSTGPGDKFVIQAPGDGESLPIMVDVAMETPVTTTALVLNDAQSSEAFNTFFYASPTGVSSDILRVPAVVRVNVIVARIVEFGTVTATSGEGASVTIPVTITPALDAASSVNLIFGADSDDATFDADSADHSYSGTTLTLPPNVTGTDLVIPIASDDLVEADEVLVVDLAGVVGQPYSIGGQDSLAVTITGSGTGTVKLRPALVDATTDAETTRPTQNQSVKLKVSLELENVGTALKLGSDIEVVPSSFTVGQWASTVEPASFTLAAGDTEAFSESFTLVSNGGIGKIPALTFTPDVGSFTSPVDILSGADISLPLSPEIEFTGDVLVAEGVAAELAIKVRTAQLLADSSVNVAITGGSAVVADRGEVVSPVVLVAGVESTSVEITTTADDEIEDSETFGVEITAIEGAPYIIAGPNALVTITDKTSEVAKLGISLVASTDRTTAITETRYNQLVQLRAFLHRDGDPSALLTADKEITVLPTTFSDAWGDTTAPEFFTIAEDESVGFSRPFRILSLIEGDAPIPAPVFMPDISDFKTAEDTAASADISLPEALTIFSFIDSAGEPRTWSYVHPYEVLGAGASNTARDVATTTQTLTLELSKTPEADVIFNLAVSTAGIPAAEAAEPAVHPSFPATLTVASGQTTGMAVITIDPPARAADPADTPLERFYVVATPAVPDVYQAGEADRVEFVVNALPFLPGRKDISFYPTELTIEQGSSGVFSIISIMDGDPRSSTRAITGPLRGGSRSTRLPAGITLTSPDGTSVSGPADRFRVQAPAHGRSLPILVDVAMDTALTEGTRYNLTPSSSGYFSDDSLENLFSDVSVSLTVVPLATKVGFAPFSDKEVVEGETLSLTVNIDDKPLAADARVMTTIADVDTTNNDYGDILDEVLVAGATSLEMMLATRADKIIEEAETFTVTLLSVATSPTEPAPYSLRNKVARITLVDADAPVARVRMGLVAAEDVNFELDAPPYDRAVRLAAFLEDDTGAPLTAIEAIEVTPRGLVGDAWGDTAAPVESFTILAGESSAASAEFRVRSSVSGGARIGAPTFTPEIGAFTSPEDANRSGLITLSAPPDLPLYNFVDVTSVPRTWAYVHPLEVTATGHLITLELSEPATEAVLFNLITSVEGIPSGEAAAPEIYAGLLGGLTVQPGNTSVTGAIPLDLAHTSLSGTDVRRFYIEAVPYIPRVYAAGVATRIEFVLNAEDGALLDAEGIANADIAFYPQTLEVEQGGTGIFSVINLPGEQDPPEASGVFEAFGRGDVFIQDGIDLHWRTSTPKAVPDRVGGTGKFAFPAIPNNGDSVRILVSVASGVSPATYNLTLANDGDDFYFESPIGSGNTYTSTSAFRVRVVESPLSFSFVESSGVPRTWAYVHPYEVSAGALTQEVLLELNRSSSAAVIFDLAVSVDGIPSGERAEPGVYSVPQTLTVAANDTTGTATITVIPPTRAADDANTPLERFYVIATPRVANVYGRGAADRVEFVVNALEPAGKHDLAFHPTELVIERGGSDTFSITNLIGGKEIIPGTLSALTTGSIPAGITLTSPNGTVARGGTESRFRIEAPETDGESVSILVEVAMSAPLTVGSVSFTKGLDYLVDRGSAHYLYFPEKIRIQIIQAALPTFSFVESSGVPRTWPYLHPYEVLGSGANLAARDVADATRTLTLELNEVTGRDVIFDLAASVVGIPVGEAAEADVYTIPATLTVSAGTRSKTVDIVIDPPARLTSPAVTPVERFYVVATPRVANTYGRGAADRVEFVVNSGTLTANSYAYYPQTLTVEAGGSATFHVTRLASDSVTIAATAIASSVGDAGDPVNTPVLFLTEGIEFHWNTDTPKAMPDRGRSLPPGIDGSNHLFGFPIPALGESVQILVEVASNVSLGEHRVTLDNNGADTHLIASASAAHPLGGVFSTSTTPFKVNVVAPATVPRLSVSDVSVAESGVANVRVEFSPLATAPTAAIAGTYTLVPSGGDEGFKAEAADYTDPPTKTFSIPVGATFVDIPITTLDDQIVEPAETLTLTIASADPARAVIKSGGELATITIIDTDEQTLTVVPSPLEPAIGSGVTYSGSLTNEMEMGASASIAFVSTLDPSVILTFTDAVGSSTPRDNILKGTERGTTADWTAT